MDGYFFKKLINYNGFHELVAISSAYHQCPIWVAASLGPIYALHHDRVFHDWASLRAQQARTTTPSPCQK
jgi:hypothetical protein